MLMCKKIQSRAYNTPVEPPLPAIRVKESRPFSVCRIDYTGALHVKGRKTKVYIVVLFTCAVTRAIHDNSANNFLLAFQTFVSLRSCPKYLLSDNATTFVASSKFLKDIQENDKVQKGLSHLNSEWKFIPSRAAWYGGIWERMIGITKNSIKKVLGKSCVTKAELSALVAETEVRIGSILS